MGTCFPAACTVENSNMAPGHDCECLDGYAGAISWSGPDAMGTCFPDESTLLQLQGLRNKAQLQGLQEQPLETQRFTSANSQRIWAKIKENWNCGGTGLDNSLLSPNAATDEGCAQACGAEGHVIAAFWGDQNNICRCYDACDGGGPTVMPQWPNAVMQKTEWTKTMENWNCRGTGVDDAEYAWAASTDAECAQMCDAKGYVIAARWPLQGNDGYCRCYDECNGGGPTYSPNTVMHNFS